MNKTHTERKLGSCDIHSEDTLSVVFLQLFDALLQVTQLSLLQVQCLVHLVLLQLPYLPLQVYVTFHRRLRHWLYMNRVRYHFIYILSTVVFPRMDGIGSYFVTLYFFKLFCLTQYFYSLICFSDNYLSYLFIYLS